MKRLNLWAIALITFIPSVVLAEGIKDAVDCALSPINCTLNGIMKFMMIVWGHGKAIFIHHFLPRDGNELWGYTALALTLIWLLGFEKVRKWAGRLSKISWGFFILLMVRNIASSTWSGAEWYGKIILLLIGGVGVSVVLFAVIPAAFKALSASFSSVKQLLNPNPGIMSCIMGAILVAGTINGNRVTSATDGMSSILSALVGVGFLAWKGWEFYKRRSEGGGGKTKDSKKEKKLVEEVKAETPVNSDAESSSINKCPSCGKMTMGKSFCWDCGYEEEAAVVIPTKKKAQERMGF